MSTPQRLEPGTLVADRYRVVEPLGEGGMGVVYSAEHTHMRKLFALKVLHRELLRMPEVVSRFEREAVLAGSINHPNVAAATDFGKLPDGSFYLVLELVTGQSLRDAIGSPPGPLEITRAHGIMRGMTAGVAAAHAKGIVHRDLKPENVMLVERDGVADFVKVLDFGIAKGAAAEVAEEGPSQPLTQIGTIMGTPQYMAPEQALGQTVDQRSDLYALGVIFYELVTGSAPFTGEALVVLRHHLATTPAPIAPELTSGLTVPVASIIAKLLAKEPADRYQTAAELAAALEEPAFPVVDPASAKAPAVTVLTAPIGPIVGGAARVAGARPQRQLSPRTIGLIAAGAAALGIGLVVAFSGPSTRPTSIASTNEVVSPEVAASTAAATAAPPEEAQPVASAAPVPTTEPPPPAEPETPPNETEPTAAAKSGAGPAPGAEAREAAGGRAHGRGQSKVERRGGGRGPVGTFVKDVKNLFK